MRSFMGPVGGEGMGGGCGDCGGVIRTVHRVMRAGVGGAPAETFSPSANAVSSTTTIGNANRFNKLQPFSSLANLTVSGGSGAYGSSSTCSDESEWEHVDATEDGRARVLYGEFVFGNAPSRVEAEHAVTALRQVLGQSWSPKLNFGEDSSDTDVGEEFVNGVGYEKGVCGAEWEIDWAEPSPHFTNSRKLELYGSDGVLDAFHLLQTEPSVQRMVISLSSDKAVWDAVMNNEVVKKELRVSNFNNLQADESPDEHDTSFIPFDILNWIAVNARAKMGRLMDIINQIVKRVFEVPKEEEEKEKGDNREDPFKERCKTPLMLSVVVMLIVVATRVRVNSAT